MRSSSAPGRNGEVVDGGPARRRSGPGAERGVQMERAARHRDPLGGLLVRCEVADGVGLGVAVAVLGRDAESCLIEREGVGRVLVDVVQQDGPVVLGRMSCARPCHRRSTDPPPTPSAA